MIHMPIAKVWVLILRDRTLSKQCTEKLSCVESLIRLVRDFGDVKAVLRFSLTELKAVLFTLTTFH